MNITAIEECDCRCGYCETCFSFECQDCGAECDADNCDTCNPVESDD